MIRERPWYERTRSVFGRLAILCEEMWNGADAELLVSGGWEKMEAACRNVLSSPAAAYAIADARAWVAGTSRRGEANRRRPPGSQVNNLSDVSSRMSHLAELIAALHHGTGIVEVERPPLSLPGFGWRVEGSPGRIRLSREGESWQQLGPHALVPISRFRLYDIEILVDAHAPWIIRPELADGASFRPTATWSWGDVPQEAARLVEIGLGIDGWELVDFVHTVVPIEPREAGCFASSTNASIPGALYVTATQRPEMLAEMLVHEAGHAWLNEHQRAAPVVSDQAACSLFASPFTNTDRPATGVLHGVVAFGWIACFWRGLLLAGAGSIEAVANRRLERVEQQVAAGLRQLESADALTEFGWRLARRPAASTPNAEVSALVAGGG